MPLLISWNEISAIEIRKKMRRQFYFDFGRRKSQILRHYDGNKFSSKISGSVSTMQRHISNLSNNKH